LCTDIGPGNTLIDTACRKYYNLPYDEDSKIALSGSVNEPLLKALLAHPFFSEAAPKTTGPELFGMTYLDEAQQKSGTVAIPNEDLVCTLSEFTAQSIIQFIQQHFKADDIKIFTSGGGARNPYIIDQLKKKLPTSVIKDTAELGINPDAKEAILFALLGNEALCGEPIAIGNNPAVLMGKFSFPL